MAADEKVNFQDHVRPIFEGACNNCHNPDKKRGGLDLTSYAALMAGGSSGEIAVSGDPGGSRLYACVTKAAEPFMPPQGDGLGDPQLDVIKRWIEGGLLDTAGGVARKAKKPAFSAQLADVTLGKPDGPPPMPENLLLEPVVTTPRAAATAALASSPWAPLVAISGQRQVLLYNTDTLEIAGVLPNPDGAVQSLQFSRNARLVVAGAGVGGKSGKVVAWEVTTGKKAFEVGEERDSVLAADLSADHAIVALGGPSRRVKLYATADGEVLKDLKKHTDWVTALQFSPDGVLLASGDRAGGLVVWEGRTGNEYFTLPGHTAAITAVSWRADGNVLASSSEDGTIRLWEMNEGKEVKRWNAHGGGVQSMAFTHDGRLVSCGRDRHVKVWKQDGSQAAAQNSFSDLPLAACFSHDGARFVVGDWSGRISVWNTDDAAPVGEMSAAPPSIDQRLATLAPERDQARAAAEAAAATLAALKEKEAAARGAVETAVRTVAAFHERAASLEAALAETRTAADSLLARLTETAPQSQGRGHEPHAAHVPSALVSAHAHLSENVRAFAGSVPVQIAAARRDAVEKESERSAAQSQMAEAEAAAEAASAVLEQHERAVARWQAARINAAVFQKKGELLAVTTRLDDLTAAIADVEAQAGSDPQRLAELKEQSAALEAEAAALQNTIDTESARYLSALPR